MDGSDRGHVRSLDFCVWCLMFTAVLMLNGVGVWGYQFDGNLGGGGGGGQCPCLRIYHI
ncbi:hypothetical protein L873DRAFT_1820690 [Choiromyces venosus 120613-1]|uniref:Uncharacterized protein n=1 Tax=Choiromyces venosus 120613-1 TaxID=1336337 RepID=A0A3N4IXI5_9PEZI|nr:hypothetical protein L873DRAFT_1820690 [Choiromyces venosus 120613-1]